MCVVCLLFVPSPFFPDDVSARSGPADDSVNVSNQDQEAACKGKATPLLPECSHCQHRRAPEVRLKKWWMHSHQRLMDFDCVFVCWFLLFWFWKLSKSRMCPLNKNALHCSKLSGTSEIKTSKQGRSK